MNYLTQNNQTIFDLVNDTYGSIDYSYKLIQDNSVLESIEAVPVSVVLYFDPLAVIPPSVKSSNPPSVIISKPYDSQQNQTVYDVCMQVYGNLNLMYKLLIDSGFTNIDIYPIANTKFYYDPRLQNDTIFIDYLTKSSIILTTGTAENNNDTYAFMIGGGMAMASFSPLEDNTEIAELSNSAPPGIESASPEPSISSAPFYSRQNQTVYDICLQVYSDLNFTYKLISDSAFKSVNTYPMPESKFNFDPRLQNDSKFLIYLQNNDIILNTGKSLGRFSGPKLTQDYIIKLTQDFKIKVVQ